MPKTLRYTLTAEKSGKNGVIPLAVWKLEELLDLVEADEGDRSAFSTEKIMLMAGGWQSWSPGWELAPGETLPARVRLIPLLRKLSAPPWDCRPNGSAPAPGAGFRGAADGSFIMYLRADSRYLAIAASREDPATPPVRFSVSGDRRLVRAGVYLPGEAGAYRNRAVAELKLFLARGYFAFKDEIKKIYSGERFKPLQFLDSGTPGKNFRPGGYASWYNHYTHIDEKIILNDLDGLLQTDNLINLRYVKKGRPAVFQIDDGWEKSVGDWEIDGSKFPSGLKRVAERVEEAGLIPGIWFAPFILTRRSPLFRERPEWLLRSGGRPVKAGWNPNWNGPFYCLDLSRRDTLEYLRSLRDKLVDAWGFRYLKLDFLYAGFLPGDFSEGGNPAELYERAVSMLTERAETKSGLPVAYLGCGLPLGASYRHFPLSRIGADTKETWDYPLAKLLRHLGRPSAELSLRDTIGRAFMNGTVYANDPDAIFLRSANCALAENEKECIALVNFLFASQIFCSDDFFALKEADFSLARRIEDLYEKLEGDEYGPARLEKGVYLLESRGGSIGGLINLTAKPFSFNGEAGPGGGVDSGFFAGGEWLLDRRLKTGAPGRLRFAPRSVSVYRKAPRP